MPSAERKRTDCQEQSALFRHAQASSCLVDAFAANVPVPVGAQAAVAAIEGALGVLVFHQAVTQPGGRRAPVATGITHGLEMPDTAQLAPEHGYVGVVVDRQGVECR